MTINMQVVKSKMLKTEFWLGTMTWAAVDRQILPPDDERWDPIFGGGQEAQRKLNRARVKGSMLAYLLENDDAFFSSVAVVLVPMHGGELEEGRDYRFVLANGDGSIGTLVIEDHVMMFPADGQHRREAIAMAVREDPRLGVQRVPVLMVPFRTKDQVRQLFSDLNLNAKPPSKTIGYAFETRDPVVVIAKRVAHDVKLFEGRVNEETNSLAPRSPYVITMNTLVSSTLDLLAAIHSTTEKDVRSIPDVKALTHVDPGSPAVAKLANVLVDFWENVIDRLPGWAEVMADRCKPGRIREGDHETGEPGYVHAFGLGWQAIAVAGAALRRTDRQDWVETLCRCLDAVDWRKGSHWDGIAMVGDRVNNTAPGIRMTAGYILKCGGVTSGSDEIESLIRTVPSKQGADTTPVAAE